MPKANTTAKKGGKKDSKKDSKKGAIGTWFKRGADGLAQKKIVDAGIEYRKSKKVSRLYLRPKDEKIIVFVDDNAFYCYVHQLYDEVAKKTKGFLTCSKELSGHCAVCEKEGRNGTYTAHYTVIDTTKFEYEGKVYQNRKVLLPAKGTVPYLLADLNKKYNGLKGLAFTVKRYTDKDSNSGSHFDRLRPKRIDLVKKFGKDMDKSLDYDKILAIPTEEELQIFGYMGGGITTDSTPDSGGDGGGDLYD